MNDDDGYDRDTDRSHHHSGIPEAFRNGEDTGTDVPLQ